MAIDEGRVHKATTMWRACELCIVGISENAFAVLANAPMPFRLLQTCRDELFIVTPLGTLTDKHVLPLAYIYEPKGAHITTMTTAFQYRQHYGVDAPGCWIYLSANILYVWYTIHHDQFHHRIITHKHTSNHIFQKRFYSINRYLRVNCFKWVLNFSI